MRVNNPIASVISVLGHLIFTAWISWFIGVRDRENEITAKAASAQKTGIIGIANQNTFETDGVVRKGDSSSVVEFEATLEPVSIDLHTSLIVPLVAVPMIIADGSLPEGALNGRVISPAELKTLRNAVCKSPEEESELEGALQYISKQYNELRERSLYLSASNANEAIWKFQPTKEDWEFFVSESSIALDNISDKSKREMVLDNYVMPLEWLCLEGAEYRLNYSVDGNPTLFIKWAGVEDAYKIGEFLRNVPLTESPSDYDIHAFLRLYN